MELGIYTFGDITADPNTGRATGQIPAWARPRLTQL
jgi:hypothetical protein